MFANNNGSGDIVVSGANVGTTADDAAAIYAFNYGGGKVTVVATGAGDVLSIKISKDVVDPEDVELLEDLVLSGVKQAIEDGRKMAETEMSKLTAGLGGMGLPGMGF